MNRDYSHFQRPGLSGNQGVNPSVPKKTKMENDRATEIALIILLAGFAGAAVLTALLR
jgi:hypothetical protein